jgi:hypothetical protein
MPAFISHSSKDEALYSTICLALDGAQIERWDPASMTPGKPLSDQLRTAILSCEVCIFLATRSSIESPWCLAEIGAFWGSRRTVLIFVADPDLTDSVLPPQFKGNLMVRNASELIRAVKLASQTPSTDQGDKMQFFQTSGEFGTESEWFKLLQLTQGNFDIMGVALLSWRQTPGFAEIALKKAEEGCRIRILMMHLDNPILPLLASDFPMLQVNIPQNYAYFQELAQRQTRIEVRRIRDGLLHFFLTRTDQYAVVLQFLASQMWGRGPLWKCARDSAFYKIATAEFETLWDRSGAS